MEHSNRDLWLGQIPQTLKADLFSAYDEIHRNFVERRWEPAELNGGKLCEVAHTILRGYVDGAYPARSAKPRNFVDACRALEQEDKVKFSQAVRVTIPRFLIAVNEIRNNRGVGHAGGEVNPNGMDANVVLSGAKWIMAELVRHFHGLDTQAAEAVVEAITVRVCPIVWEVAGRKRVLCDGCSFKDKVLLLLHSHPGPLHEDDLRAWAEHPRQNDFRRDVLRPLHRDKYIEFDEDTRLVHLSPKGTRVAEEKLHEKSKVLEAA